MTAVTDKMVEAARAAYSTATGCNDTPHVLDGWIDEALRAALTAALSTNVGEDATPTPSDRLGVIESQNSEAGFVEFINSDVPYIVRDIPAPSAILLDMETRQVIGYRVYDPATAPASDVATSDVIARLQRLTTNTGRDWRSGEEFVHGAGTQDVVDTMRAALALLQGSPPVDRSGGWQPIGLADKSIATVQSFPDVSITLRNSYPVWVRDEDGRTYEAVWSEGHANYWWDLEGESPVDPVEFMPHPLDPRFAKEALDV